jgi:hypothetical protein
MLSEHLAGKERAGGSKKFGGTMVLSTIAKAAPVCQLALMNDSETRMARPYLQLDK